MKDELIKQIEVGGLQQAEHFLNSYLGVAPPDSELEPSPANKKIKYLPISYVETKLDELFFGAWEVRDFRYQVVANEIIGSLQLKVYHPVLKIWIERTGCGAVQIQMKSKDNGGDGDIANVRNKIINTLEKDFPHLKAECTKNAARSLGKAFGRDVNRKHVDEYEPLTNQIAFEETKKELELMLGNCRNKTEISMLWEGLEPEQQQDDKVKKLFTTRKAKLITL